MSTSPPLHDGQADAMPCACPACASPSIVHRPRPPAAPADSADRTTRGPREVLREARAC